MNHALVLAGLLILEYSTANAAEQPDTEREVAIRSKLMEIIVPRLEFREATIREAVSFLKQKAVQLDPAPPEQRGVSIILKLDGPAVDPNEPKVTLSLSNIPFWEALRYVAEIGHLKLRIREYGLELSPDDAIAPAGKAPAPPAGPVAAKLEQLVLPKLEFRGASLVEGLDFLRQKAVMLDQAEPDPRKRGVNLVYVPPRPSAKAAAPPKVSLALTNVALGDAVRQIAELASVDMTVEEYAVVLRARAAKP